VRAWTYLGEGSGVNGGPVLATLADLTLVGGGGARGGEGVRGEGAVVQRAGEGRGGSGGDAPWYGEREREREGARAGRGRREACLAGGHGAVLVSSAAGAAEVTIPPSCRRA
jgi:hypothetical protein